LHRALGDGVAKAPVAIDHRSRRRFLDDRPRCAGHDVTDVDAVDIRRDLDDAVRVVAGQIGVDAVPHDDLSFSRRCPGGDE